MRGTSSSKQYSFLKFDLGTASGDATLRLFVTDSGVQSGNVYEVADAWSEGGITWNTMPALGTRLAATQAATAGTWLSFDLGSVGRGVLSLAVAGATSDVVRYASSESANPPQLTVAGP